MNLRRLGNRRTLVLSATVLAVASAASPLLARLAANTIDPVLVVSADGRHVTVTGPITCDQVQPLDLTVTLTQRTTGAIATGHARTFCTAEERHWQVEAWVKGNETFEQGAARTTAIALTSSGHTVDDAHQWLVDVTLVGD